MNGNDIATRLGWSTSKVSRMFSGKRGASPVDVSAILAVCDILPPKRDELLEISRHAAEPGWWQEYGEALPVELRTLSEYEDAAITITSFETVVVPGLLQTPDYMRALIYKTPAIPNKEIPARIAARKERQGIFDRPYPARFRFFIDEYALSRTGPGGETMSDQVHHLLRMAVRPYVEIRIIPDGVGFHPGQMPFKLMDFMEFHPVVFIESQTSALFLERRETIASYRRVIGHLASVALDERLSREWLATLATELGAPREENDEYPPPLEEEFPQQSN